MLCSIWRLVRLLAGLYGLVSSGFLILRSRVGERWWPIAFMNSFAHLLMLPSVILLPISLLTRRRWLALTQLIPLYSFLESYGRSFDPRRWSAISHQPSAIGFEPQSQDLRTQANSPHPKPLSLMERGLRVVLLPFSMREKGPGDEGNCVSPESIGNQTLRLAPRTSYSALTLMTYNVHKESRHLDPMIAVIRQIGADVVAFQELSRQAADCFAAALADEYPYRALHAFPDRWRGQGILSRYPITADEYWWNAHVPGSMGHQRVELDVRGMKVTVYNTHPVHPGMEGSRPRFDTLPRHEEIRILVARAAADEGPVILAGDFNLPDQAEDYRYITSHFVDAFREVGWGMGFTFPDFGYPQAAEEFNLPPLATPLFLRLDYIFHNEAARAIEARVWPDSGGADHRPVVVKLGLLRGPVG